MKDLGIGISTSVGIGGDPINGSAFKDHLAKFEKDDETKVILMIGEIGGPQEAEAAEYAKANVSKPVVAYIAGLTAPKGKRMGHAGAIVSAEKVEILKAAGITIAKNPSVIGETIASVIKSING
jgi:succinyl-CoA synthetase alpha subunit/malate-CoA ligase subunit alpha